MIRNARGRGAPLARTLELRALPWFFAIVLIVGFAIPGMTSAQGWGEAAWSPVPLSDDAELPSGRDVVMSLVDFMKGHETLQFESLATYQVVQDSGQKIRFDLLHRMMMRKPDKLFWVTLYDNAVVDSVWYNQGTFTLLKQPANVWGTIIAPPRITEAVERLVGEYRVVVPFADLLSGDPAEFWLGEAVTSVEYVGEAWIDGQWTDHVTIRKEGVDLAIWIRKGEEPFPVRMAFDFTEEQGQPSYIALFRNWSSSIAPEDIPGFTPPVGSERIEIVPSN